MKSVDDFYRVLLWTISIFLSILVHELGHAFMGRKYGAVPVIHLHGLGGLAAFSGKRFSRRQHIAVTAAGPAASFALALASLLFVSIIPQMPHQIALVPKKKSASLGNPPLVGLESARTGRPVPA